MANAWLACTCSWRGRAFKASGSHQQGRCAWHQRRSGCGCEAIDHCAVSVHRGWEANAGLPGHFHSKQAVANRQGCFDCQTITNIQGRFDSEIAATCEGCSDCQTSADIQGRFDSETTATCEGCFDCQAFATSQGRLRLRLHPDAVVTTRGCIDCQITALAEGHFNAETIATEICQTIARTEGRSRLHPETTPFAQGRFKAVANPSSSIRRECEAVATT